MSAGWLADTLIATGLLIAAVTLLRVPVRRMFGSGAAYALWALPALRLVLPPMPARVPGALAPLDAVSTVVVQPVARATEGVPVLFLLWAAGAVAFLLWQLFAYRLFAARALAGASPLGVENGVELLASPGIDGPVALGFLRRRILLPADWNARYLPAERLLALRHEATHHARLDLWANAAALSLVALHWFNPLAHWAYRLFRQDQELACDAAVVGGADPGTRETYARALVKTAAPPTDAPNLSATLIHGPDLKRRVTMLHTHKIRRSPLGALAVSALTVAGLGLTATSGVAQTVASEPATSERIFVKRIERKGDKPLTPAERETLLNQAIGEALGDRCKGEVETVRDEITTTTGADGVTRVLICGPGGDRLARLEGARERLSKSSRVKPANRAKALAALDEAIAQARAQR